jgi:ribonucleoside-diphosphate reductase alpha chain
MTVEQWLNHNQLSIDIWKNKYQWKDETLDEWFDRVSGGDEKLKELIINKKFIFGGRILASRGVTDRKVTYSNCYVISPPEDNLESIFDTAKKLARTYSYGGGCGVDVSKLAPKGSTIHNAAKTTSGATSFMDFFSYVTGLIGQEGRRGALMISIDCTHPDLIDFINLKTDPDVCTKANISVRVSDEFMKAAAAGDNWELTFHRPESDEIISNTVNAQDVLKLLALRNWEWAEPGILYWDRISNFNLLDNSDFEYAGVNPCAEEPLPAGGSCLLGSLNLAEFVDKPFTSEAHINYSDLMMATKQAVIALNKVLDEGLELHPLEEQRNSVRDWRQIGLGTLGLGDMFIKLGVKYGSDWSLEIIDSVYKCIANVAIITSNELAKTEGCYPKCNKEDLLNSKFLNSLHLEPSVLEDISEYGLHNSQLLTCAPTGSIGTMLEVSTGVEPNFALSYMRKTQSLKGKDEYYSVNAKIVNDYRQVTGNKELPDYFITSESINPTDRIRVQGRLQKYIDASISSTINLPESATKQDVYDIYVNAWKYGLKGVTVYRSGCNRGAILSTSIENNAVTNKRPKELEADLHLVKANGEQFIVLIGLLNDKPYEVFAFKPNIQINIPDHKGIITKESKMHYNFKSDILTIPNLELANNAVEERATTLYASMLLRHNANIKYIVKTARKVNSVVTSFTSAVCRVLNKYLPKQVTGEKCPECGADIINEGGCKHCSQCGWSKCE